MELPFVPLRSNRFLFRAMLMVACGMCLNLFASNAFGASLDDLDEGGRHAMRFRRSLTHEQQP
jgi:hypothetical protein